MYINKPSVTKIEAASKVNLLHGTSCGLNIMQRRISCVHRGMFSTPELSYKFTGFINDLPLIVASSCCTHDFPQYTKHPQCTLDIPLVSS